jgi:DNA-binding CsgD family transcriptional regulator
VAKTPDAALEGVEAVTTSAQVLLVVDADGDCVELSLGACRVLGMSRDAVVGRALGELLEPASRERFAARWPAALSNGGRIGNFALSPPASLEVEASVVLDLVDGRHIVALEAAPLDAPTTTGRFAEHGHGREPTAREREVLDMLADGATDDQIASSLQLSPATVQTHVRNAKAKLGARTRAQAVALALHRGLIGHSH